MENHENYILIKYTKEIELSEVDIDLNIAILEPDYDDYDKIIISGDGSYERESEPIHIDAVIKALEKLKSDGANYVEIMYHCDHHGYVFNGAHIKKATPEEIKEYINSKIRNNFQEKVNKAIKLQKELDELNKELNG